MNSKDMDLQNITISELYGLLKQAMPEQTREINKNIHENTQKVTEKFAKPNEKILKKSKTDV